MKQQARKCFDMSRLIWKEPWKLIHLENGRDLWIETTILWIYFDENDKLWRISSWVFETSRSEHTKLQDHIWNLEF